MTDASNTEWAFVVFFFSLMSAYSFFLGSLASQVLFRLESRGKRSSYQKWGADKELFQPNSIVHLIGIGIFFMLSTVLTFSVAFLATDLVARGTTPSADRFLYTVFFAMSAVMIGFMVESRRVKHIKDKTRTLDDLREVFHQNFSPSELLSMYEGLRPAPPLFWEEYAGLPDDQVSDVTNRSYRERAAPYGLSRSSRYNRIVIVVAVLTLLLTTIVAAKELIP